MPPETSSLLAQAELDRSRLDIQRWLAADAAASQAPAHGHRSPDTLAGLVGLAVTAVTEGLLRRSAQAPPPRLGDLANDTAIALLSPVASRHPWALVGVAALAGAALAAGRPWRGLVQPAALGGLLSRLALGAIASRKP